MHTLLSNCWLLIIVFPATAESWLSARTGWLYQGGWDRPHIHFSLKKIQSKSLMGGGEFGIDGLFQQRTGYVECLKTVLSEQPGEILIGLQWQLLWQTWRNIQGISRGKRTFKFHTTPWLGYGTKGRHSNNSIHKHILYIFCK